MGIPEIASILAVVGTVLVAVLAFRFLGFRPRETEPVERSQAPQAREALEAKITDLQEQIVYLQELVVDRDERFENLMRIAKYELDKRFQDLDRDQLLREREQGRHLQREAEQSRRLARPERRFALPR